MAGIDAEWCGARSGGAESRPLAGRPEAGRRPHRRDLEGVERVEGREQPGQALGEHRLARARWPDEQQVVPAGGGDLERPPGEQPGPARRRGRGAAPRAPGAAPAAVPARRHLRSAPGRARRGCPPPGPAPPPPPAAPRGRSRSPPRRCGPTRRRARAATIGSAPGTGRTRPSRPSSPTKASPPTASGGTASPATSAATAMARSRPLPSLRRPGGARLIVTRRVTPGHARPADWKAAVTRCTPSRQEASGRPTSELPGRPWPTWTSTWTRWPLAPRTVADGTVASIEASSDATQRSGGGRVTAAHERDGSSLRRGCVGVLGPRCRSGASSFVVGERD